MDHGRGIATETGNLLGCPREKHAERVAEHLSSVVRLDCVGFEHTYGINLFDFQESILLKTESLKSKYHISGT